ncbi:phage terminase large subunit family protein [Halosimplex sp. J119]
MSVHTPSTPGPGRSRKAVLFCPECGHESETNGDWNLRERAEGVAYECPDCETVITTRSRAELPQYA